MQQRIVLAQALMNDPELIVLDEPTDGLDPVGRKETRDMLQQLRARGKTIFLNSHLLSEVEQLCDRVAILVEGKVVCQGTINELTIGSSRYIIELGGGDLQALQAEIRAALPCTLVSAHPVLRVAEARDATPGNEQWTESGALPSGETVELVGNSLRIGTGDALRIQPVLDALRARGLVIQGVRLVRQSLEDYFIQTVSGAALPAVANLQGEPA
jgi:ABC-2 type transport system ATP-binding protein